MMQFRTLFQLSAIFVALMLSHFASAQDAEQKNQYEIDAATAEAYASAYSARDIDALSALLADEAIFEDPSNRFEGKTAIQAGLTEVFGRITSTGPDSREINKFRSGSTFIYMAFADFNMMMSVGGAPEQEFNFKVDFAMTLKVEKGKVIEHRDYVDTEAFLAQLQRQLPR